MNKHDSQFEKALSGRYQLSIKNVFERANDLTKKNFTSMVQAIFVLFFALTVLGMLIVEVYGIQTIEDFNSLEQSESSIINIIFTLALAPLIAGIIMMGIKNARGQKTTAGNVFSLLSLSLLLALGSLVTSILITLGIALFILPGLYLYLTTKFTLPLIADRGLSPISAIIMSIKILHKYVFHILLITLVFALLMMLVIMTLGLAFVWVGPLYFNVFGILYQDIVGGEEQPTQLEEDKQTQNIRETHFDA
ncbi:stress protein [Glaciecola sp. KUL10]|uniref:stress protein n=1 Tax=Glaciecola sp. (strain KUL10) TaxID=2161813 RepID=UPI000D782F6C|nr:stress protein [Glaciecola sp. KUL10]GBL02921.1 stress-induced protein UspE [Glaciecola sp. KUL10]